MKKKIKKNKFKITAKYKAFSLMELVIAMAISAIIALSVSQIFLVSMKAYERNKNLEKNLNEGQAAMEIIAKNMRMSASTKANSSSDTASTVFMYNNSQELCVSYKFDNANKKLQSAYRSADLTDPNNPACSSSPSDYTYNDLTSGNVTGYFRVVETNKPGTIGRGTITMTFGTGTNATQTLETSVSFMDYHGTVQ